MRNYYTIIMIKYTYEFEGMGKKRNPRILKLAKVYRDRYLKK